MAEKETSHAPIPLRPPNRPVTRRFDENRGNILRPPLPSLPSDRGFLPSLAIAEAFEAMPADPTIEVTLAEEERPAPGYL